MCDRFVLLAWGTGLGIGVVIDGEVQEYPDSLFPEFGHSRVSDDNWLCNFVALGCVDAMAPSIAGSTSSIRTWSKAVTPSNKPIQGFIRVLSVFFLG